MLIIIVFLIYNSTGARNRRAIRSIRPFFPVLCTRQRPAPWIGDPEENGRFFRYPAPFLSRQPGVQAKPVPALSPGVPETGIREWCADLLTHHFL